MKVPNVRWNLVPNTWTTDREGTLPKLSVCSHDNCCFGRGGMELVTTGFCRVELYNLAEICWSILVKNGVHQGGDLEFNSCLHRQPRAGDVMQT